MKKVNSRWARWLALLAALSVLAAACSGGDDGDGDAIEADSGTEESTDDPAAPETDEEAADEGADDEEGSDEVVTIRWFMRWDDARVQNVAMPIIEEFEAANPNIKVEFENIGSGDEYYQKLQTSIAGNVAPDVFYPATHVAYALGSKEAIASVDTLDPDGELDLESFDPNVLELYQIDGEQMCLPIDTAALVVFYNKEMFDAAGVEYPQAGWTWDDFLATAEALSEDTDGDGDTDVYGVNGFTNYWPLMVWSETGHNVFDDQRNPTEFLINEQESIDAIQWLADLTNVHGVMPDVLQTEELGDMFAAEIAAMNVVGHWRVPRYLSETEIDFDFAPLPVGAAGPLNRADGSCFAVSSQSEHPEEAFEFVKFLAGPGSPGVEDLLEMQVMVPAITEFQTSDAFLAPEGLEDSNKEAFLASEGNLYSMYDPLHPVYAEWEALWQQELNEVWLGNATAQDAVEYMEPFVGDMLANLEDYE